MYKNNVPLPDVSVEPPFGPQINTSSEMGCCRGECEIGRFQDAWSAGFITRPMKRMDPELESK